MTAERSFLTSPTGQLILVGAVLVLSALAILRHHTTGTTPALPAAKPASSVALPKTLTREGAWFSRPASPPPVATRSADSTAAPARNLVDPELPLVLLRLA